MLPHPNVIYTDPGTSARVSLTISGISRYYKSEATDHATQVRRKTYTEQVVENSKLIDREMRAAMTAVYQGNGKSVKLDIVELVLQDRKKVRNKEIPQFFWSFLISRHSKI